MVHLEREIVLMTLLASALLSAFAVADATPPIIIDALEPRSGPVGSEVAVSGAGFSAIAAENSVTVCPIYGDTFDDHVTNYIDLMRFDADSLAKCLG